MKKSALFFVSTLFLSACSVQGQLPSENNDVFYSQAQSHRFAETMTFRVNRSVGAVAKSFQAGAACLNQRVVETSFSPTSAGRSESNYRGEVVRGQNSVTLNLRRQGTTAVIGGTDQEYRVVMAEARAISGGTQIRIAGPSINFDDVFRKMSEWARGQRIRCPRIDV